MVEVNVQSLGLDRTSNTPVVILQEVGADRVLPIWIGGSEASAIALELGGKAFERPLTQGRVLDAEDLEEVEEDVAEVALEVLAVLIHRALVSEA